MDHDREIGLLGGGIELVHAWVAQRDAIDVAADFNAAKPQRLDVGQAACRQCRVLDRDHADSDEVVRDGPSTMLRSSG